MKDKLKKILVVIMILVIVSTVLPNQTINAKSKNITITIEQYIELLVKAIKAPILQENDKPYIKAAMDTGVLLSENEFNYDKDMNRSECAVLTNRADIYINGASSNTKIFDKIKDHKRISDLDKINKSYRDDVVQVFGKGIIVGYTNGKYTQDREFRGSNKITYNGAKAVISKLVNSKKRSIMSPDGQLTRTTKLPCNAKEYDYILASFPNKFYEMKFSYEYYMSDNKLKLKEDYYRPVDMKNKQFYGGTVQDTRDMLNKYLDLWVELVEKNLECRFNVDYRTIDKTWGKNIKSSYINYANKSKDNDIQTMIDKYIEEAKKNKVIVQSKLISVERSTLYDGGSYYLRCYVKFKVQSAKNMNGTIVYSPTDNVHFKNLKKNVWHEGYYDISLSPVYGNSDGDDVIINGERISDNYMQFKKCILKQKFNKKGNEYAPKGYYYWG